MSDRVRVAIDPAFEVRIPPTWTAEADEDGGVSIAAPEGPGLLHLMAFEQEAGELLDPGEELYVFLEDQGIELEEDEIEDVELGEGSDLALCEYTADDGEEDREEGTYWLVGVATAPGSVVFCNYSCPAGQEEEEREEILAILRSLRLRATP